jgi:hypothetical protein
MKPIAPAYMKLVCLFLSRCALRLFLTSFCMEGCSSGSRRKNIRVAREDSKSYCRLIANMVSPIKRAMRMMKNTCKSKPKLNESKARGIK